MRDRLIPIFAALAAVSLLAACTQAPAPAPTQAPSAPKAAEPTKAPAVAPTAAPAAQPTAAPAAAKTTFPEKGKPVTLVVAYPAGGGADIGARVLAPLLEKELGTSVQVVNKAGAGSQVGVTDAVKSKPDGYTIGYANFSTLITLYLDPSRQAAFARKDFQPVALHLTDPEAVAVKADSKIKDLKDLVDAAKANPGKVRIGTSGIMSQEDLMFARLNKEAGVNLTTIAFDGAAPAVTAMLGDNIEATALGLSSMMATVKGGQSRVIASIGDGGGKFIPGVKSFSEQGFKGYDGVGRGWFVPAGTPMEVVNTLSAAMKRAMQSPEHESKIAELGQVTTYKDPVEFGKYWNDMEVQIKPLVESMLKK